MNRAMGFDLDTVRINRRHILKVSSAAAAAALVGSGRFRAAAQGDPALAVVSPADGATVATNEIPVQLSVSNFTLDGAAFGRPDQAGAGEILAFVDGTTIAQLTNFYSTDRFVLAGDGLAPGPHTLTFVLASSTHVPIMATAQQITIDFQPPQAVPLPIANYTGDPVLTLVSPHDGATVASSFEVQVRPTNFTAATALEGKTNVPGYGHYHVWVDTPEMPSSLAGLALMPGTNGFTLDLSAWGPGEHTVRIEPAQNDHTMYDPATPVEFTVTVDAGETAVPAASPAAGAAVTVQMTDQLRFAPEDVTIAVGQAVTWVNESAIPHTTTGDPAANPVAQDHPDYAQLPAGAAPWDSGLLQTGQSFSYTFTVPGTYHYFCTPHVLSGMRGTITVQG
jgi:plastocyanin